MIFGFLIISFSFFFAIVLYRACGSLKPSYHTAGGRVGTPELDTRQRFPQGFVAGRMPYTRSQWKCYIFMNII